MSNRQLIQAARRLSTAVNELKFAAPVAYVYNPLGYAWDPHEAYLRKYGSGPKRVIFLGMNPGPFGMVQTGVPFGEIAAVRDWLRVHSSVGRPERDAEASLFIPCRGGVCYAVLGEAKAIVPSRGDSRRSGSIPTAGSGRGPVEGAPRSSRGRPTADRGGTG